MRCDMVQQEGGEAEEEGEEKDQRGEYPETQMPTAAMECTSQAPSFSAIFQTSTCQTGNYSKQSCLGR